MEHSGHRERLKNRFRKEGLDNFEPHNILELLLFYSIPQKDTNPIAHKLIDSFGSLSAVFDATYEELMSIEGIGANTATLIKLIPEVASAYIADKTSVGTVLNSSEKLGQYLIPKYIGARKEIIYMICMDSRCRFINMKKIGEGSFQSAPIDPRDVVKFALYCSASTAVLAHNHPDGFAIPSNDDLTATKQLYDILNPLGVKLVDHIIVADDDFVSLADSGFFNSL